MNNKLIEYYYNNIFYPCLIFYLEINPNYGKNFNIEDVEKPSQKDYDYFLCDCATLGRKAPLYEDWSVEIQKRRLKTLLYSAECELQIQKTGVLSFQDICKIKDNDNFVRYVDEKLNQYFDIKT